jgi:hypothetical protein
VERRLAGLSAGLAEVERRLRVELELAAVALRVDMVCGGGETLWFLRGLVCTACE